jgi:hypothetical protein
MTVGFTLDCGPPPRGRWQVDKQGECASTYSPRLTRSGAVFQVRSLLYYQNRKPFRSGFHQLTTGIISGSVRSGPAKNRTANTLTLDDDGVPKPDEKPDSKHLCVPQLRRRRVRRPARHRNRATPSPATYPSPRDRRYPTHCFLPQRLARHRPAPHALPGTPTCSRRPPPARRTSTSPASCRAAGMHACPPDHLGLVGGAAASPPDARMRHLAAQRRWIRRWLPPAAQAAARRARPAAWRERRSRPCHAAQGAWRH